MIGLKSYCWGAAFLKEDPALVQSIHHDYMKAGADIITTSTFKASVNGFAEIGVDEKEAFDLCVKSTRLAHQARDEFWANEENRTGRVRPFIAASLSPYCGGHRRHAGKIYNGNYQETDQEYKDYHRWLIKAVIQEKPDILAFEAMPRLDEVRAICQLLEEEFPDQLAYICFVCLEGTSNSSGDCIMECAQFLNTQPQVIAFGTNCMPPEHTTSLIKRMRSVSNKPLIVYPNSGETWDHAAGVWHQGSKSDEFMLQEQLPQWKAAGATVMGGCCRTNEAFVSQIRSFADASNKAE